MVPFRNCALVAFLASVGLVAPPPAAGRQAEPPAAVREALDGLVRESGAPGVALLVYRDGRLLYRAESGRMPTGQALPVASASKWMAAATIMTLVDDGLLELDEPIGRRLPEYRGEAGRITLRQLLSYTAGQGGLSELAEFRQPLPPTLRGDASRLAARPLRDPPGEVFRYGGPSFQIAGALAEQAAGQSWAELFQERIAQPLGLRDTHWDHTRGGQEPVAPNLQAGLVTTAEDYGRFLGLIAGGGVVEGRRLLSAAAIRELTTAQTLDATLAFKPPGAGDAPLQYALGSWCESHDAQGRCALLSSPGVSGVYPWIDFNTGLYGVFFARHPLTRMIDRIRSTRLAVESTATPQPFGSAPAGDQQ